MLQHVVHGALRDQFIDQHLALVCHVCTVRPACPVPPVCLCACVRRVVQCDATPADGYETKMTFDVVVPCADATRSDVTWRRRWRAALCLVGEREELWPI